MRKIAATYVFPVTSPPLKNGIITIDETGKILNIEDTRGNLREQAGLEYYNGILVPGFVNAHCHTELSHLKNKIPEKTGLGGFIGAINKIRKAEEEEIIIQIRNADREMYHNGIVAVGDISNQNSSLEIKKESKLDYFTFIEVFGFLPERADRAFSFAENIYNRCNELKLNASIVPHSPYSVSGDLFKLIKNNTEKNNGIVSIHNQESKDENLFYRDGTGEITEHLKNNIGLDISGWKPTGQNSLPSIIDKLPQTDQLLLVHNTFTTISDIRILEQTRDLKNIFFVLCPNANLYISNSLPDVELFRSLKLNICLGTDSLASNGELSILSEMKTVQKNFKETTLEELIKWATINGARALRMENKLGSFEVGKKPGINLIEKADLHHLKLTSETKVRKLI
ncbi:MAG: amidohydrolase family protein [Prolixibacteraceae bacterium]|nr:amidohydrolase family protein [Prolixibacteraceae bacterium]MBN2774892.1 amidohydrolase family protein [Prolixibacteraceae bacterium]